MQWLRFESASMEVADVDRNRPGSERQYGCGQTSGKLLATQPLIDPQTVAKKAA